MKGISEVILKFCEKFTCITLSVVFIFYFFNKHPGQIKQLVLTSTHPKTGWGLEEYINILLYFKFVNIPLSNSLLYSHC